MGGFSTLPRKLRCQRDVCSARRRKRATQPNSTDSIRARDESEAVLDLPGIWFAAHLTLEEGHRRLPVRTVRAPVRPGSTSP